MNWIKAHFQRYRERTPWAFCWRITIECLLVSLAMVIILVVFDKADRDLAMNDPFFLTYCVTGAPIIETLLFQAFPVWIARKCNARFSVQVLASLVPFFAVHAMEGVAAGLGAGLVSGFYLAFTYAHWRVESGWTAFWTTAVSHALHNGALLAIPAMALLWSDDASPNAEKPVVTNVAPALPAFSKPDSSPTNFLTPPVALPPDRISTTPPIPPVPGSMPAQAPPAPSAINPGSAQGVVSTYVVVRGDTLSGITNKTVSVKAIEDTNPGTDPLKLKIGKELKIPDGTASAAADKP